MDHYDVMAWGIGIILVVGLLAFIGWVCSLMLPGYDDGCSPLHPMFDPHEKSHDQIKLEWRERKINTASNEGNSHE